MHPSGRFHVHCIFVAAGDGHEFFHVFSVFLDDNVDGVVVSDNSHQCIAAIEHRQSDQIILLDFAGHVLLVVFHTGKNDVAVHDVRDPRFPPGHDKILERNKPQQLAVFVNHISVIDRLFVRCDFA